MPYSMDNMPESMKGAPKHAMEIFIAAFNTAFEKNHVEGAAIAIAMSAVHKAGYKKDGMGSWMSPAGGGAGGGNHAEWIPIFKTGTHTSGSGITRTWTEADIDKIVAKYDPKKHEAPAVIGHPEHDSPAYGWVEALKREGEFMYAKFKNFVPAFIEMVQKGLFKKRSIRVDPDGVGLIHVGWLGANPPAVKGLPDVSFQGDKGITIEFGDLGIENSKLETQNSKLNRKEAKSMKWFDWLKGKATAEGVTLDDAPVNFAETGSKPIPDIKALVDAQVAKVVDAKNLEFAEAQRKLDAESSRLKAESDRLKKAEGDRRKAEIASFCEGLCKDGGRLTPAMMKYGIGMETCLESISGIETTYEFSEGDKKKTQTPFEYMKGFLSSFKKQIEFGEFAGNDKDIGDKNKREAVISDYQEKNTKNGVEITYKDAVLAVSKKNPELFRD